MSLELPLLKTRPIKVSIVCKSQCNSTAKKKLFEKKKIYRYFTNVGATETERLYIGVTKELRKEWEKEIIQETEGGK
jgi:hypothetical protein